MIPASLDTAHIVIVGDTEELCVCLLTVAPASLDTAHIVIVGDAEELCVGLLTVAPASLDTAHIVGDTEELWVMSTD